MGLEQGCGKGLPGRPPAPSVWLGPCQPPVPPPGEEEDGGGRMKGGSPQAESGLASSAAAGPLAESTPR